MDSGFLVIGLPCVALQLFNTVVGLAVVGSVGRRDPFARAFGLVGFVSGLIGGVALPIWLMTLEEPKPNSADDISGIGWFVGEFFPLLVLFGLFVVWNFCLLPGMIGYLFRGPPSQTDTGAALDAAPDLPPDSSNTTDTPD